MQQDEIWKDIKGYEGYYEVSNLGRVRTVTRQTLVRNIKKGKTVRHDEYWLRPARMLKPIKMGDATCVHLYREGQPRRSVLIKRLVAEAFIDGVTESIETHQIRLKDRLKAPSVDNITIQKSL